MSRRAAKMRDSGSSERPAEQGARWRTSFLTAALLLVTLFAYYPAWQGGMVWDDDGHITRAGLRGVSGLARIWFDLGATQQYYPVVHSAFWLQHRLWGDATLGYHLVNIVLHVTAALLVALLLRRLTVPGAWLAAFIFALHPVQVESVAWISELKNTLSAVFYLGAALAYCRFDTHRVSAALEFGATKSTPGTERETYLRVYVLALLLYGLALLSKTVTATLPAALLVVFWWRRGSLQWRREVMLLVPFAALGLVAGLFTTWVERTGIGARGADFDFTFVDRGLIAGRAIWFYLSKLAWPANLVFIYPRWQVSAAVSWQYLFPAGIIVLLAAGWRLRTRSRAPLAAFLVFCVTLLPVLGFVNVYPFRFSFVADHFQYLASIGPVAAAAASVTWLLSRFKLERRGASTATVVLGSVLAAMTWQQSRQYADAETLYRATIARNPTCWMAYNNLGASRLGGTSDDVNQAITLIRESLQLNPRNAEAHNNLGFALQALGQFDEAIAEYREAIALLPGFAEAYGNLGSSLTATGLFQEAVTVGTRAIRLRPDRSELHSGLGDTLLEMGRVDEAMAEYREALRLDGRSARAHNGYGNVLVKSGRLGEAIQEFETAIARDPNLAVARDNLGTTLQALGRLDEAIGQHRLAIRLRPMSARSHYNLGNALQRAGRASEAIGEYAEAVRLEPDLAAAHSNLGSALLAVGRLAEVALHYRTAVTLDPTSALTHHNLGIALRREGNAVEALASFQEALRLKPDYAAAHCEMGNVLLGMRRVTEAITHYRASLASDPASAEAHNNLGVALQQVGRSDEALREFHEAARIAPDFEDARANLARARAARAAGRPPAAR